LIILNNPQTKKKRRRERSLMTKMTVMMTSELTATSTGLMLDKGERARALFVEVTKKLLTFKVKLMSFQRRK
jgi:hypothetical protein